MTVDEALELVRRHAASAYPGADTVLLCGSTVTGTATATSDLDVIVIYPRLPDGAFRETVEVEGKLVEAFVHDPGTLAYFVEKFDRPSGVPILANMITGGVPVPGLPGKLLPTCKDIALTALDAGPTAWNTADVDRQRYTISNLVDDIHSGLSAVERIAIAADLWTKLADFALRASGNFSGTGKGLARALQRHDTALSEQVAQAISNFVATGESGGVGDAVEVVLGPYGGRLVAGYRAVAPKEWRIEAAES